MTFHAPSFLEELRQIIEGGMVSVDRFPFLMVVLIVLTIGARYCSLDAAQEFCPGVDVRQLERVLEANIEQNFLRTLDDTSVETITFTFLLTSFSLYNRNPSRGYKLFQTVVRDAQLMNLHSEATWNTEDSIAREVRRRIWWTIYGSDGFAALVFGKPRLISDTNNEVEMQKDIDDTNIVCPGIESQEPREHGMLRPVTILSYHRYKVLLYKIGEPITRNVYFHRHSETDLVIGQVQQIHRRLLDWRGALPPELKLDAVAGIETTVEHASSLNTFKRQALALGLAYDNMQIVLHRSLIAYGDTRGEFDPTKAPTRQGRSHGHAIDVAEAIKTSRNQCWESAVRTSMLGKYADVLELLRTTPVAAYFAIHALTAGVMLGIFALTDPCSERAQTAKLGISRLIQMPTDFNFREAAWQQCADILENLLRLILSEEMKVLVSGRQHNKLGGGPPEGRRSEVAQNSQYLDQLSQTRGRTASVGIMEADHTRQIGQSPVENNFRASANTPQHSYIPWSNDPHTHQPRPDMLSPNSQSVISPREDFGNALSSLQNMFRDHGSSLGFTHPDGTARVAPTDQSFGSTLQQHPSTSIAGASDGQMHSEMDFFSSSFPSFQAAGQSWLWNDGMPFM
ncbi:hypothetical protein PV08_03938 [Exophiala spinifera]|uniref:Xylanolytic transcriptional activator regulatory domain-containing protein n=1 Tax=Exophiala spinifera TaxID=91928 RepID=A0A0D2BZI6_9EURO|nr:uncharacterized protein PV08_03938 [Exophiala spinifera]KIW16749.1 hypothetical protein PV08_03938 [Exophiala spinifera]